MVKFKKKDLKRSAHSGRIINGREAILTAEAVEYVKTMGYRVLPMSLEVSIKVLSIIFICLGALSLIPSVSASVLDVDVTSNLGVGLIIMFLIIAGFLYYKGITIFSSLIALVTGFVILMNDFVIFGFLIIGLAIFIAFSGGKV
jgi:hypothetical protein